MRFAFNNHSITAKRSEKLKLATRRLIAGRLQWVANKIETLAYRVEWNTAWDEDFIHSNKD